MEFTYKLFGTTKEELENFLSTKNVKNTIELKEDGILVKIFQGEYNANQFDDINKQFILTFNEYIYAEEDISLASQLVKILTVQRQKIAVAESFTGGNIAGAITAISGASQVFHEGIVAYSNSAKISRLKVKEQTIDNFKPVSAQVAYEMACGLIMNSPIDFAISTTGIAGPNSDDSKFPVGLCYIGIGTEKKINCYKYHFKGTRQEIVTQGVKTALFLAIKALRNSYFNIQ